ncbi:hypothetical protein MMC21_005744 [Puttea exsequens]|nr:hypothetical protein [Puttea exsequens]
MISRKDTPAPSMHAEPPRPLSLRPAAQSNVNDSAPQTPRTPQNRIRTKRVSNWHRPAPRDAYTDGNGYARAAADENFPNERISHDLSLTDNTGRHSVVDNMLMSLNPDQSTSSANKDRPTFSSGSDSTLPPRTSSRHLGSSSIDSDFSFPLSDSSNQPSHSLPRGRRSNSSTNYQSALSRIVSVHIEGEGSDATKQEILHRQRTGAASSKHPSRRGGASSRGSGSSSVDLGHMSAQSRRTLSHKRRSASFDDGRRPRILHSASSSGPRPPLPTSPSQPSVYNDFEAAPTPTVPGGPRKDFSSRTPSAPIPRRRNSNKSAKSYIQPKKKGELGWSYESPMVPEKTTRGSRRSSRAIQVQPVPTYLLHHRNQSPRRDLSESVVHPLMPYRLGTPMDTKDPAKDRPGFFRRMFGSSKGSTHSISEVQPPQLPPIKSHTRASSREGHPTHHRMTKPVVLDDHSKLQSEAAPPPLVKKPSSFFRRRKKSVSDSMPPPMLPSHLQQHETPTFGEPPQSPTSSLRQVMNPFLDDPMRSDARQFAGTAGYDNNFPHTHTMHAKGSGKNAPYDEERNNDAGFKLRQPRDLPSPRSEQPPGKVRPKLSERTSSRPQDDSFFHDDSSNDTRLSRPTDDNELSHPDTVRLDRGPASMLADADSRDENVKPSSGDSTDVRSQRSLDTPKERKTLLNYSSNMPGSNRPSTTTPYKSELREWLTPSQTTPTQRQVLSAESAQSSDRVWLQPERSQEPSRDRDMSFPTEAAEVSPVSDYHSANSTLGPLPGKPGDDIHFPEPTAEDAAHKLSIEVDPDLPSDAERAQAKQIFDGNESIVEKSMAAAWLGDPSLERERVRRAYLELFDWQNLNILAALRGLCGKLYLKGEAQQVDRILDAFSSRWCACNPKHGFKAKDVVHTICYSVLLLNTDLHQAEIETKMTRTQFLKNILPTVRRVVMDAAPNAFTNARASTLPPFRPGPDCSRPSLKSPIFPETSEARRSFEGQRPIYRLSQRPSDQTVYTSTTPQTPLDYNSSMGDVGPLVKTPFHGKLSTWENQVEIVLKDFFNSIRQQPLPLYGSESKEPAAEPTPPSHSLSAMSNMLRRTPSTLSKAGSENVRGRGSESRLGTGRWQSKNRSRPRLYPASTVASSRRSSFDEQSSVTSPSVTSAWSRFSSFGKTQTSLSIDSFASNFPHGDYQQSIGFANALSQAIIREEGVVGDEESLRAAPLLEDESLELAGAPWAKEGILKHKHHLESVDKKAKDRGWTESFVVVEKGYVRLFSFSMNAKSLRRKAQQQKGSVVGGGNWADNAESLGTFLLRQTIASALPPPGYSKTRPHVWALSLPTGAVHLFQAGTPEIVKEFVTTANYWSARLSKEPMVGGISNIEYGWGESVINPALLNTERNLSSTAVGAGHGARPSMQSSIRSTRSSIDQGTWKPRLPGDRIMISEWTPPQQSMVASVLMEVDQLRQLSAYVKNITEELEKHNELRAPMLLAFSSRHPNNIKAMTNWEKKSSYLLREIVKFRTYIDCLQAAQVSKEKFYAERKQQTDNPHSGDPAAAGAQAEGTT